MLKGGFQVLEVSPPPHYIMWRLFQFSGIGHWGIFGEKFHPGLRPSDFTTLRHHVSQRIGLVGTGETIEGSVRWFVITTQIF